VTAEQVDVVVVGAGPVGLAAALFLARQGVDVVVVDAAPGPPAGEASGSKAATLHREVVDALDRLGGTGRRIADEGVAWTADRVVFRDRDLTRRQDPDATPRRPVIGLPQWRTEQLLDERARADARVDLRRGTRVDGLEREPDGVALTIVSPAATATLRARWVVGCDGAHSTVRRLAGIGTTGLPADLRFLSADVRAELPLAPERHVWVDPPSAPGLAVLAHPLPEGLWRVDWQIRTGADLAAERDPARVAERFGALTGGLPAEVVWTGVSRPTAQIVTAHRDGRVLLAGDAVAPGAAPRSLDLGLGDAENLAWKLALVLCGQAPDALLDTYATERRPAAEAERGALEDTLRFLDPPGRARRTWRDAVLRATGVRAARRVGPIGSPAAPPGYRTSPIVLDPEPASATFGPGPGTPAPDGRCRVVAGRRAPGGTAPELPVRLRDLVGPEFLVLAFPFDARAAAAFVAGVRAQPPSVPTVVAVAPPPGGAEAVRPLGTDGVLVLDDVNGDLAERYERWGPGWFLLRPDGHVGANGLLEKGEVARIVDFCTGRADRLSLLRVGIAA